MSHFVVWVLTTQDSDVDTLLAPYDENIDVPAYPVTCECKGLEAGKRARAQVDLERGSLEAFGDQLKQDFAPVYASLDPQMTQRERERALDSVNAVWKVEVAARKVRFEELMAHDPEAEATDPACTDCHGSGTRYSTYNPKSKWDWYEVGGRWDGHLDGYNSRPVKEILNEETLSDAIANKLLNQEIAAPFAVITPDGEWHERGRMGWFGVTADEMQHVEWTAAARSLLESNRTATAVVVDCHI